MSDFFEHIKSLVIEHPYLSVLLTTFASEDTAYFYSLFANHLSRFKLGIAYVTGVVLGDVGLYMCGWLPKKFKNLFKVKQKTKALKKVKHVQSMDIWLMMTRFIPGSRIPTYSYLGYQNYSLLRFVGLLLLTTVFQISVGFTFAHIFAQIFNIQSLQSKLIMALSAMLCSLIVFKSMAFMIKWKGQCWDALQVKWMAYKRLVYKEFWPSMWMYGVFIPGFIYLSIKHWSFTSFLYCNPGIKNSGFIGENKEEMDEVLKSIPQHYKLRQVSIVYQEDLSIEQVITHMKEHQIDFPCYAKPMMGHKGFKVKRIGSAEELEHYWTSHQVDFLVQELCSAQEEMGLYFMKYTNTYEIFSITKKVFPQVQGDGQSSLKQLVMQDPYYRLFSPSYFKKLYSQWNKIVCKDQHMVLTSEGNHSQGCIFQNGIEMASPQLKHTLNAMLAKVEGVNIGRFDLKYNLKNGELDSKSIKIIELNGASGEPTHIYDRKTSLYAMYKAIYQQYDYIFAKGKENSQHPMVNWSLRSVIKDWYAYLKQAKA